MFLIFVFFLYWFAFGKNLRLQNYLLLLASYIFYAWWDWRFLFLLLALSLFNYFAGLMIGRNLSGKGKGGWLVAGLIINIGVLGLFKYYNFFIEAFIDLISVIGYELPRSSTSIILPLGISFYTFLSISYLLDIFKENINPDKNLINVLLSLSFFPIILAGPIQRPSLLLPQIRKQRQFNYNLAVDGLRQFLWGLFAKVVIADKLAPLADDIFRNYHEYSGSTLLLGAIFFSVQIYADFAGYSNMAIGTGKLLGFSLMKNFDNPYFARDITDFWKKWHISLTTWFRDYLFLPLSFSLSGKFKKEKTLLLTTDKSIYILASIITWLLTGLWHGANYTFIVWGLINGLLLIIYHFQRKPRKKLLRSVGLSNDNVVIIFFETCITLTIIIIAWIFFKADSLQHAFHYLNNLISASLFSTPEIFPKKTMLLLGVFFLAEWLQRDREHALQINNIRLSGVRWALYCMVLFLVMSAQGNQQQFIYFQF